MLLEGHGRVKPDGNRVAARQSTGIKREGASPKLRKALRAQAEEVYHARMIQLARARVGLSTVTGETFERWAVWYDTHHIAKHRGAARERDALAHLIDHFGPMRLTDIKPARWTEYETTRLAAGASPNTIGRELAVMKATLVTAVGEHLEVSPLAHVKRKTKKVPPKRTVTAQDEKRLIAALRPGKVRGGTFGDEELLDLYLVAVGTLLRQENVILLQRKHFHANVLTVETKTGPHRLALQGPTMLQMRALTVLKRRLPKTREGYFFPRWAERWRRLEPSSRRVVVRDRQEDARAAANKLLLQKFRRACTRAEIPWGLENHGVVWHTATRASGATRMIREHGIDVRTVQLLGNWSSLDQMASYLGIDLTAGSDARSVHGATRLAAK